MTDKPSSYTYKLESGIAELPCQNCGRLVLVSLPFIGCVFCGDCIHSDSGWNDGSEQFYEERRTKWKPNTRLW